MAADLHSAARKAALASLWQRRKVWPLLEVYLDRDQLADARRIFEGVDIQSGQLPPDDFCLDISRQRGKSWLCCVVATVLCHCLRGFLVNYASMEQKNVRSIVQPTMDALLADCPAELRPSFNAMDNVWEWREQGSRIRAFGCNNKHYVSGRGPRAHLNVWDECGFYDEYDAVEAVLTPQLQTTRGFSIRASSPPETPAHPHTRFVETMKGKGRHSHRTIYGHPRMSPEEVDAFLRKEAGKRGLTLEQFKQTSYYRREYLAMHIVEVSRAVCPEWSFDASELGEGKTLGDLLYVEVPRPPFCDWYDSLDIGFTRDPSAWLGAYWDWDNARLVVEDESEPMRQFRAETIGETIIARRRALWPASERPPTPVDARRSPDGSYWMPHLSVGDGSGNGAEKLKELHEYNQGLDFAHAEKPDLEARVNRVRGLVAQQKLWVHPRCKTLRKQLATGLWADKLKSDFERTEEGHLDHFAALVDLVHAIDRQRCPIPQDFGRTADMEQWRPVGQRGTVHELDKALGGGFE